jgi:hypothetical protein
VEIVELTSLASTSPSLAEVMRSCMLRAGLSRAKRISAHVLGNPKAWLGTAYHAVLEAASKATNADCGPDIDQLWTDAISHLHEIISAHPLNRRFGAPETWPGYHVTRASVLVRANDVTTKKTLAPQSAAATSIHEQEFVAVGGKLRGRPDVIRGREIVDYKSGAITEYNESEQTIVVKAAYVRQLRIYGYLVKETLGWWPERGTLFPAVGAGVEVLLTPEDCEQEAAEAVAVLDRFNESVVFASEPAALVDRR